MSAIPSASFFAHFARLKDPRIERTKVYPLMEILFVGVCAMLGGANDFVGMEKFGNAKLDWFKKYLTLANGIPSHDTFGRVFAALDPQTFLDCFRDWVRSFLDAQGETGRAISIDGKTARASLDRTKVQKPLHVVSAWINEPGLVLGQVAVDEKSNEITAIPKLLEMLELTGAIVTIDAMGCQREIARKISDKGGDYIFGVKGNQEFLENDIIQAFAEADERREAGAPPRELPDAYEDEDTRHGRKEHRRCEAMPLPKTVRNGGAFAKAQSIARITRTYTERGEAKSDVRYVLSSLPPKAKVLGCRTRGHWGIENGLHWVLDMAFGEDRNRARTDHAQENLSLLRRWLLSLLKQDKTMPGSIEKKRLQAGWNVANLENLLQLF